MKNQVLDRSLESFADIASLQSLVKGYILNCRCEANMKLARWVAGSNPARDATKISGRAWFLGRAFFTVEVGADTQLPLHVQQPLCPLQDSVTNSLHLPAYSYRSASTGAILEARMAGYRPDNTPILNEMPRAIPAHSPGRTPGTFIRRGTSV